MIYTVIYYIHQIKIKLTTLTKLWRVNTMMKSFMKFVFYDVLEIIPYDRYINGDYSYWDYVLGRDGRSYFIAIDNKTQDFVCTKA